MVEGYAGVARELTRRHGLRPALDRRQVYEWNRRRTLNADGRMFPSPVEHGRFDVDAVDRWYSAGRSPTGQRAVAREVSRQGRK